MWGADEILGWADAFLKYNDEPVKFDPWQEIFLTDLSQFSILLKGRQEGFSFVVAAKKFIEAQDPDVKNITTQIVSYNLSDAVDKIRYISIMAHSIPEKRRKKIYSETKTSIEFLDKNGKTTSRIVSIACRPPRGKPGSIVLDECAIYGSRRSKLIYTAALPSITRGGTITIGSTPLGKIGIFYEIYTDEDSFKNYTRYTVPWWYSSALCTDLEKARRDGVKDMDTIERVERFGTEILKEEMAAFDLESFQQEYECVFIDSAESYIPLDLIYANTPGRRDNERDTPLREDEDESKPENDIEVHVFKTADDLLSAYSALGRKAMEKYGQLYMGYDVARRRDAAVIFVIGYLPNGKKLSVAEIEMRNEKFEFQMDQFRKIMRSLPVVRACIDQTGQGEPLYERLREEFKSKVEGVIFNIESKGILALNAKTGLERFEFLLQNDSKFHHQIHSIKRIPTEGGKFRYDSERDGNGHADSFWAWALANHAVIGVKESAPGFYQQWKAGKQTQEQGKETGNNGDGKVNAPRKKGKSYASVIRGMDRAARK